MGGASTTTEAGLGQATESMFKTKEEQVADYIRERIISGEFMRGQKLKQAEIAKALNFSITPVREALKMLTADGYLIGTSHRGVIVAPFQINAVEELFELRLELETRLAKEALARITPEVRQTLEMLNNEYAEASAESNFARVRRSNYRFHFLIYELAEQPQTLHFVRILWAKYPFDLLTIMPGRQSRVVDEHKAFLKHLDAGDHQKALRAMRAHLESGWVWFRDQYGAGSSRVSQTTFKRP